MILRIFSILMSINISLFACGGSWDYSLKQFIFLEERAMPFSSYTENLDDSSVYNDITWKYKKDVKEKNLQTWEKKLNYSLDKNTIEKIVYHLENIDLVKNKEIKEYLHFVKKQEMQVTDDYYTKKELAKMLPKEVLLKEALSKIESVNDSWLKLRYFYLALRLSHYSKKEPLKIYERYKYLLDKSDDTLVKDWIQGIYAGALIKNKNVSKGVYEFSKLFDTKRANWHLSFYNFHQIKTNEQWNKLISFTENNDEKTKLYALRALDRNSNAIEELKNIYKIDKNSRWFDFLLFRQLSHSQHYFNQYKVIEKNFQTDELIKYLESIKKDDMYLINLSLGYLNLYKNNLNKAKIIASFLLDNYPKNHEVQTFNYVLDLHLLEKIDIESENIIYKKMTKVISAHKHESNYIHDYTFVILNKLYSKQKDSLKAFLSKNINSLPLRSFDLNTMNKFKEFISNKKESKIEEHFQTKYLENENILKENKQIVFSRELKKTQIKLLINNLKFKEALIIKSDFLDEKITFNPFNVKIRGNNREGKTNTYTLREFLNKLLLIKKQINKNPKSVMDNYLYANALYNLSYFGNSNTLTTVYRSVYSFSQKELESKKVNDSIYFYKKALKYANKKEFKAKITYMLAKSELALFDIKHSSKATYPSFAQVKYYNSDRLWRYSRDKVYKEYVKNGYGEFFNKLEKDYSNTNYYKELIRECANLSFYQKLVKN